MGYEKALIAAGAVVFDFKQFGDYQGQWIAAVSFNDQFGFVEGAYGSCSGCDAFEAEFGWFDCISDANSTEYQQHLAKFGKSYLEKVATPEEFIREYKNKLDSRHAWSEDQDIYDWIKNYKFPVI